MSATPNSFRVASRRAQSLLEKHLASKRPPNSTPQKFTPIKDETPWPKSLRYAFYTACVAAVPFTIGSIIAISPRLRDSLADETDPEENGVTSNNLVHLVRYYWGNYDYIPPTDRRQVDDVVPGRKLEWQDDNWSSFLAFLGLYAPKSDEQSTNVVDPNEGIPISLENEPPAKERHERTILARFLSPEFNPAGVKVRLSLLPSDTSFGDQENSRHEFQLSLPSNASLSALRRTINVSSASDAIQKVNSLFPGVSILQSEDATIHWNGTYRCVLDFDASDDVDLSVDSSTTFSGNTEFSPSEALQFATRDESKIILSNTSSHSSWAYFPDTGDIGNSKASPSQVKTLHNSISSQTNSEDVTSARIEQLKYQISMLQKELKDPSSLRDRGKLSCLSLLIDVVFLIDISSFSLQMTCMRSLKLLIMN
jgi:hypothetical protein